MEMIANRYRVLGELGRGGMGVVYRVADTVAEDRELALKTIRAPGPISPALALQFKEEFRAMSRLRHPNTLEVYDFGHCDDAGHFITMELVPGVELAERLAGIQLAPAEAYPVLIQLLQALRFIHARGYIHRDIKAQNIRIRPDGTLKLMDFGLMGQRGLVSRGTQAGGTPGYIAPEVVRGGVIDAAADLYSVGCLAYEMLTGELPFTGRLIEVLRAHVGEPPPPLARLRPGLPERLEAIVAHLLEKEPMHRYRSTDEVIADLSALAGHRESHATLDQQRSYLVAASLVGREAETAALQSALQAAASGRGAGMFVGAPPGVGKSRLVQELALAARLNEVVVLTGACRETGGRPYGPITEVLRNLATMTTPGERERHAKVLEELFVECEGPAPDPLAISEGIVAWMHDVASRLPLLVVIEDAHWIDPLSALVWNHMVREAAGRRMLLVATMRTDEVAPGSTIRETIEEGAAASITLAPFGVGETEAMVKAMFRDVRLEAGFVEALWRSTGGNAYFLTEVLRGLIDERLLSCHDGVWHFPSEPAVLEGVRSIEATVARRLMGLSPEASALARVAAVLGADLQLDALLAVSALDEETLFSRLDELVERQFVVRRPDGYAFPHDMMRRALYSALTESHRRMLHQRSAEFLEAAHAGSEAAIAATLAHHYRGGTDPAKAYFYLRLAADQAQAEGALATALTLWGQAEEALGAYDHPENEARRLALWWAIGSGGYEIAPRLAITALEKLIGRVEAAAGAEAAAWAARLPEAMAYLAHAYGFVGRPTEGLALAERAYRALPAGETPLHGAVRLVGCASLLAQGRGEMAAAVARDARRLLVDRELEGLPRLVHLSRVGCASYQNAVCYSGVRPSEALRDEALEVATRARAFNLYNVVKHYFAVWYAWTGRATEAGAVVEAIAENCRRIGAPPYAAVLYLRPFMLWQQGEFHEALAWIDRAFRYPHLAHADFFHQLTRIVAGQVHAALGAVDEAEAILAAAERHGRERALELVTLRALMARAQLALATGDHRAAGDRLDQATAFASSMGNALHEAICLRLHAERALLMRDPDAAAGPIEAAMAIVSRPEQDNRIEQAHLHLARAEMHMAREARFQAIDALREAGEAFEALRNRYHLARVVARLEAAHRLSGRPPAALPPWAQAWPRGW